MAQGICGESHMTPFSRKSRPVVNVIWAWVNLIIGLLIFNVALPQACSWVWAGAFLLGLGLRFVNIHSGEKAHHKGDCHDYKI